MSIREADIEAYLVARVKALGGEVRKVQWVGRKYAPDRLVMLPMKFRSSGAMETCRATIWVEVKRPDTVKTFPANAHERGQAREHQRMRALGQRVEVIGTHDQVDELLK